MCVYCNTHEWDEILEVNHINPILKFDKDVLISEINDLDNLQWICPNHHALLDK